jgi:carbon storage regulator
MLVLSRRVNEAIVLPEQQITIRILSIQGNRVRLGILAPANVHILRQELCEGTAHPDKADVPSEPPARTERHRNIAPVVGEPSSQG